MSSPKEFVREYEGKTAVSTFPVKLIYPMTVKPASKQVSFDSLGGGNFKQKVSLGSRMASHGQAFLKGSAPTMHDNYLKYQKKSILKKPSLNSAKELSLNHHHYARLESYIHRNAADSRPDSETIHDTQNRYLAKWMANNISPSTVQRQSVDATSASRFQSIRQSHIQEQYGKIAPG
jgi:hypothetical protein